MINEITRTLNQQQYQKALSQFLILLNQIRADENLDVETGDISVVFTTICNLFNQIILHDSVSLTQVQFDFLIDNKSHLMNLYDGSQYQGTESVLKLLLHEQDVALLKKNDPRLGKFLILYSLFSTYDVDFLPLIKINPSFAVPALLDLCSQPCVLDIAAREKQQRLLLILPQINSYAIKDVWLDSINHLWMHSSYLESGAQHLIKKQLNGMLQKWLKKHKVTVPNLPSSTPRKKRPVILVAAEYFTTRHALYRCFAPSIAQLREHFTLILMVKSDLVNEAGRQLFDRVVEIEFEENTIRKLVGQVIKLKPDMIYYPSLGMDIWTLLLANLRLAPIQFMSSGNPSTSYSPYIDYYLLPDIYFSGNEQLFSETLILLDYHSYFQMIAPHNVNRPATLIRYNPKVTRVAVPVNHIKLSTQLMQVCQQIKQRTLEKGLRKIEFHFFSYPMRYQFLSLQRKIQRWIPDAIVHPAKPFEQYLIDFNQCDIQLNGFPFDGTNSCTDAILQCIPFVSLQGEEPFSRLGIRFVKETSLPDWLLVDSVEAYIEAALRLIHNDTERFNISRNLKEDDFIGLFMDSEHEHHEPVFGQAVKWLYQNHEKIQADGRKVWRFNQVHTFRNTAL